jgi:hypothetical protein
MNSEKEKIKECLHCKLPFKYKRISSRYCSASCRQMAWVKRKSNITITVTIQPVIPEKKIGFVKRIINWFAKK